MKLRIFIIPALLVLGLISFGYGQVQENPLTLTLEDCIVRAMKNNLSVAVQVLNPEISAAALSQASEKFYPSLALSMNKQDTNQASYSFLDASGNVIQKNNTLSAEISQTLPGGGSLRATLNNTKTNTSQSFQTINPRYGSTLTFNLSQPLLKGFGWNISRREILIARNSLAISESNLELQLANTVYNVEQAYWNLVNSIDSLEVSRQSLSLARDLLEKNKRSVEVGQLAPIDILSAQAEVASLEAGILQAEATVKNNEDQLKTLLNISEEEKAMFTSIVPKDKPNAGERTIALEEAMATALQNRPELKSQRMTTKTQEMNLTYAKNQLLPDLSLSARYWSPGISGTQILYLNNNPLSGIVIGRLPGGSSQALKDAMNFKYQNWSVGLTLTIPTSNVFSRAAHTQAKLNLDQAILNMKNQEQQIYLEITTAVRAVETNFKRIGAYKIARELAEQKLAAEEEKRKVGLSTNYLILQYQRDLANARSSELRAVTDYSLSLASLDKALGLSLKNKNIELTNFSE